MSISEIPIIMSVSFRKPKLRPFIFCTTTNLTNHIKAFCRGN